MKLNSPKLKSKIKKVLLLTAGWVAAGIYINIIQHSKIIMESKTIDHTLRSVIMADIIQVFLCGLILASFEVFYFTDRFKKKSFGYAVMIKSIFYGGGLSILIFLIVYVEYLSFGKFSIEGFKEFSGAFFENIILILLLMFITWGPVFLISIFILQVSDKYEQGILLKFILGKYHTPRKETRIFMFLDIASSTTIAEALGSVKNFELLQDFFYDVTDSIIEAKGEIYQYVGDEIVISWKLKNGVEKANCLNCFFDIYSVIKKNSEKYQMKYDLVPTFKAGLHYGEVTVGEIGVLKSEIIFSGDVLNTTSRIQEFCNKYNEKLIVSKDFLDLLKLKNEFILKEIGPINLRGKAAPVILDSVKKG